MTKEELILLIAESLIEPRFPDDAMKEAENIAGRIEKRMKSFIQRQLDEEIEEVERLSKRDYYPGS